MIQNYHVHFYERTQLLAHQGKGQIPYFFLQPESHPII
jgi:hypothetical protein